MKKISALSLLLMVWCAPSLAQSAHPSVTGEMKKLDFLVGQWQGEGWIMLGPNQRHTFRQTENVQRKVGGTVLLIEGLGKSMDTSNAGAIVHNAFAVLSYDKDAKVFRWRAFRADGSSIDTEAKVSENMLIWGFRDPRGGNIRFTIKLNEKGQWYEIGEMSRDGQTWLKFFEMTLNRVASVAANALPNNSLNRTRNQAAFHL